MGVDGGLSSFITDLFAEYEKEGMAYCVLRNYENLPSMLNLSDIDILIDRRKKRLNKTIVNGLAKRYEMFVYSKYVDERFDQYYLGRRLPGGLLFLHIDFFCHAELYGIKLVDGDEILTSRKSFKNFFIADDVHRFLDKWLNIYLLRAQLAERYQGEFTSIVRTYDVEIAKYLSKIFGAVRGRLLVAQIDQRGFLKMSLIGRLARLMILCRNFVRDVPFHLLHVPQFFYYRLKYLLMPKGEFISFSGPDGSGKTTVLELAKEQLATAFRMGEKNMFHFRPSVLPRIAELAKNVNLVDNVDRYYSDPHRAKASGLPGSIMRLAYYALDYLLGYFKAIRPILVRRELVISDRYFYDLIADPGRSRIALPFWMLSFLFRLMPGPHTAFFIHASPEKIGERKQELKPDEVKSLNRRYLDLAREHRNFVIIENNGSPEKAAAEIVDAVITRRAQRLGLMKNEAWQSASDASRNEKTSVS